MSRERTTKSQRANQALSVPLPARLLTDIRGLIEKTRQEVARTVDSSLVMLYWHVGCRIRTAILKSKRAEYGEQILPTLRGVHDRVAAKTVARAKAARCG